MVHPCYTFLKNLPFYNGCNQKNSKTTPNPEPKLKPQTFDIPSYTYRSLNQKFKLFLLPSNNLFARQRMTGGSDQSLVLASCHLIQGPDRRPASLFETVLPPPVTHATSSYDFLAPSIVFFSTPRFSPGPAQPHPAHQIWHLTR